MGGGTRGTDLGAWANFYLFAQCMGRTRFDVENVVDFNLREVPQRRICEYRRGRGGGWMWRKRMLAVGRRWNRIFQSKKYSSAGDLYLDGAGAGAKRMSAHGRFFGVRGEKQKSNRSCFSALSLSQSQAIGSEGSFGGQGIFDGMVVGVFDGGGEGYFGSDGGSGLLVGTMFLFGWAGWCRKLLVRRRYS